MQIFYSLDTSVKSAMARLTLVILILLIFLPMVPMASGPVICIHYLGHASFVLEFDNGIRVLTDYGKSRAWDLDSPIYGLNGLVPDVATISHDHLDHAGGTLPEGTGSVLRGTESLTLKSLEIQPIPTYERQLDQPDNTSFLFIYQGLRILHLGDCQALIVNCDQSEVTERIARLYPDTYDLVLLPIGFTRDIVELAAAFSKLLDAKRIVPMHYWNPVDKEAYVLKMVENRAQDFTGSFQIRKRENPRLCLSSGKTENMVKEVISLVPARYSKSVGREFNAR